MSCDITDKELTKKYLKHSILNQKSQHTFLSNSIRRDY